MGIFSDWSFWQLLGITLLLTHITIAAVTIFLHRSQAHRAVTLAAPVSHFFRAWLWLTTGMVTREWVAIHRKHHAFCETEKDPHSPKIKGVHRVLWGGALLYREEAKNQETLDKFGAGTPDDWLERHVYAPHPGFGIALMFIIDLLLFGFAGAVIWLVQMIWIPFWAAGVINGLAHHIGYRSWNSPDASTNISPIGILIGGEELHNNHHAYASSARLSYHWYEFDIGWMYICILQALGLAKVRKTAPRIRVRKNLSMPDADTALALLGNRLQVLANYRRQVVRPVVKQASDAGPLASFRKSDKLASLLSGYQSAEGKMKARLQQVLTENDTLETVYQYQQRLQTLLDTKFSGQSARVEAIQDWVNEAEQTGVAALQHFARSLRGYTLA